MWFLNFKMNKIDFKIGHPQMIEKKTTQVALSLKWILFENILWCLHWWLTFKYSRKWLQVLFWSCWPADDHENIILMTVLRLSYAILDQRQFGWLHRCVYLTTSGCDGIKFGLCVSQFLFYEGEANLGYQLECVHWSPQTRVKCFVLVAFYLTWTDTSEVRPYTMLDTY